MDAFSDPQISAFDAVNTENPAPLADASLQEMQGLSLDALEQMHAEAQPAPEAQPETPVVQQAEDVSASAESSAHPFFVHEEAPTVEASEPVPEPAETVISEPEVHNEPMDESEALTETEEVSLSALLSLDLEEDTYHLAQMDDLARFRHDAQHLFEQRLPQIMEKLSKTLHAHEQINHLYEQLAQLSSQRESAVKIMQTAKQIESMEEILASEQLPSDGIAQAYQDVLRMQKVLQAYGQILAHMQKA